MITYLLLLLLASPAQAAIECQRSKGPGNPWAWREIDGKRCWYQGYAGMDKARLSWRAQGHVVRHEVKPEVKREKSQPEPEPTKYQERVPQRAPVQMWPNPPDVNTFRERWLGQ